jgi:hypothetical protein
MAVFVKAGRSGNGKPADGRVTTPRAGWVVALLACAALAAGCGSSSISPSAAASPANSSSPAGPCQQRPGHGITVGDPDQDHERGLHTQ